MTILRMLIDMIRSLLLSRQQVAEPLKNPSHMRDELSYDSREYKLPEDYDTSDDHFGPMKAEIERKRRERPNV
jgi:hypothetical protein